MRKQKLAVFGKVLAAVAVLVATATAYGADDKKQVSAYCGPISESGDFRSGLAKIQGESG